MNTMKFKFYSDPGHGWMAVKRTLLVEYGVLDRISFYSYQRGDTVYLEEDCDAPTLITVLASKGFVLEYDERHTENRSPIRSCERFSV